MHHPFRFACTASTIHGLIAKLETDISGESASLKESPPLVFVFTGQGSHYAGMGGDLYRTSPAFRDRINLCVSFFDIADTTGSGRPGGCIGGFWESVGVTPSVAMGHSLGDYVSLHIAGVLSLADMLYLVGRRALLLLERSEAHTYAMLNVSLPANAIQDMLQSSGTFGGRCLGQQMRHVVNFVGALNSMTAKWNDAVWLEVWGLPRCNTSFIRATLTPSTMPRSTLSALESPRSGSSWLSISKCLAMAYNLGVSVDWLAFHSPFAKSLRMVNLPSYAWDLKDFRVPYVEPHAEPIEIAPGPSVSAAQQMYLTCLQYVVEESVSPEKIRVTMCASLSESGLRALIEGHQMVGQPIASGSIFCEAAFAATTYALRSNGRGEDAEKAKLAILNLIISRPLNQNLVGAEGQLLTTVVMEGSDSDEVQISWRAAPSSKTTRQHLHDTSV
ncbi:RADS2 nonreducing polyketide synthase [Pyrenophora teres f. maculata]|nr:RADS2 nonreducing polyketide synthase [Pyrenophora teres f. maculata]